ncbi:MAG TPA: PAS domain S-box protein, partial [Chitinivibrionales bacterium]
MNDLSVEILNLRRRISELEASEKELLLVREELKKSEEKYRMAFEYTGTAMMVFDADTTILMANHRIEQITGYTEDEVKGKSKWVDFVDEENRPKMLDYNRKRLEMDPSVPVEYEFKFRHKTGRLLDVLINVSVIPGADRILVSLVDITERKRIEKALAESERKYRDLFENANDIIYVHDSTGTFISANKAALTTVGYSMEELLKINIRDIVDPAYLPLALKNIAEKIDKKVSLT